MQLLLPLVESKYYVNHLVTLTVIYKEFLRLPHGTFFNVTTNFDSSIFFVIIFFLIIHLALEEIYLWEKSWIIGPKWLVTKKNASSGSFCINSSDTPILFRTKYFNMKAVFIMCELVKEPQRLKFKGNWRSATSVNITLLPEMLKFCIEANGPIYKKFPFLGPSGLFSFHKRSKSN